MVKRTNFQICMLLASKLYLFIVYTFNLFIYQNNQFYWQLNLSYTVTIGNIKISCTGTGCIGTKFKKSFHWHQNCWFNNCKKILFGLKNVFVKIFNHKRHLLLAQKLLIWHKITEYLSTLIFLLYFFILDTF